MHEVTLDWNNKKLVRKLPEKWDELTLDQLLYLCKLPGKKLSPFKMRQRLAYYLLNLNPRVFFRLKNYELLEIMKLQDFLFDMECDLSNFLINKFSVNGITFYGPGNKLLNSTVAEIAYADSYLQLYDTHKNEDDLCRVIAALYRPTSPVRLIDRFIYGLDIRKKFNDRIADRRAKRMRKLPAYLKAAIYYQFKGCRTVDVHENPELHKRIEDAPKTSYGWAGVIINMAGAEIGTMEDVEVMLWSNAKVYLNKRETDRQEMEARYKNENQV